MKKVSLITFKGCKSTIDLFDQLEARIVEDNLEVEVEMVLVPFPEKAMEMGLFGSPTILINGVELQQERRGPTGFY
jgi:hypothetical protein